MFERCINHVLQLLARLPLGTNTLRLYLHKLRRVEITGRVWIGKGVFLENTYPECFEVHDEYGVNFRSVLWAHCRGTGKIIVDKKARIGACCLVTASPGETIVIGEGSMVAAGSVVTKSVASYTLVGRRVGQAHRKPEIRAIEGRFIQTIQVGNHASHASQDSGSWCFRRGTIKVRGMTGPPVVP